ncbi:MAG: fasciclin domain-containing protein, partial [Cyclonatronaceae bacterium]
PTNDAFAPVNEIVADLSDEQLTDVLQYHVLEAQIASTDLQPEQTVESLNGDDLFITVEDGMVSINGGAAVADADILASNGIIHAIDGVLLPDEYGTIVDNVQKRYFLTALVDAVVEAGLAETLADPDAEFTVFAPTNEAFEAIADVADDLSQEELSDILLYHVVEGNITAGDLEPTQTLPTLNGDEITITAGDEGVFINADAAEVTRTDAVSSNGVFHVIDGVLLPPEE